MHYSRRDFLKFAAAGLPVVGASWNYATTARAGTRTEGAYTQARADRVHSHSTAEAIERAGENPEEVKARVDRRLRELRASATN
ncbi:MAG: twin-arginine translocation signal domain-containing protein [Rubrobacter sp.]|nr:twin-arginine translocation signal domain-containing protein [Rubrobacter sp.]